MKRTLGLITIIATALIFLFTACNADATAGLFYQLAHSKEPVGIRYKQIIGKDVAGDLLFLTNNGIYSTADGKTITTIKRSEKQIHAASLDGNVLTYITNKNTIDNSGGMDVYQIKTNGKDDEKQSPVNADLLKDVWSIEKLLANGIFIIHGTSTATNENAYSLAIYNGATKTFTNPNNLLLDNLSGYGFVSVLQMTGRQDWELKDFDVNAFEAPIIASFVTSDKKYIHYYITNNTVREITGANTRLAAFSIINDKLYLLDTDGRLYGSDKPAGPVVPVVMNKMDNYGDREYEPKLYLQNTFLYAVSAGGKTHLVSKPENESKMYVISFDDNLIDSNKKIVGNVVSGGYARQMEYVKIVSAYEKAANKLLIATEKNGMFEIVIDPDRADKSSNNGTSTGPEIYTVN